MLIRHTFLKSWALSLFCLLLTFSVRADVLNVGQPAPEFQLSAQDGSEVRLLDRLHKGWTVLYFYPKAGTPGCTTQACAFRDAINVIRQQNAEVYGISTDELNDLLSFYQKHKLSFDLLSDSEGKVAEAYGVKFPLFNLARRWTFIIDPDLVIRQIDDDVDPALDASRVAKSLQRLQASP